LLAHADDAGLLRLPALEPRARFCPFHRRSLRRA